MVPNWRRVWLVNPWSWNSTTKVTLYQVVVLDDEGFHFFGGNGLYNNTILTGEGNKYRGSGQNLLYQNYDIDALSFYGSKMILDQPNHFGRVPIVLDRSKLFWSDSNHFGPVQIIKNSPEKSNLNLTKMIWTRPKRFGHDQNNLYQS